MISNLNNLPSGSTIEADVWISHIVSALYSQGLNVLILDGV